MQTDASERSLTVVSLFRALSGLGAVLALFGACGGTTRNRPGNADGNDDAGGGGTAGNGSHVGGTSAAGKTSGGSSSVGGSAGDANDAGTATGGKRPDLPSTGGAPDEQDALLACDSPYAGPNGGPRPDGPEPTGSCAGISDTVLLARYDDFKARVPQGLYYEAASPVEHWELPCAMSLAETSDRGSKLQLGTAKGKFTTDWFYEAEFCQGNTRHVYRNLRCDYFDGEKLANPDPENLAFLGSLLWWADNWNHSGAALLGYAVTIGDATDWVELCTLDSTSGDFGLCDEVRLMATPDLVRFGGKVTLGQPELLRSLKGKCH